MKAVNDETAKRTPSNAAPQGALDATHSRSLGPIHTLWACGLAAFIASVVGLTGAKNPYCWKVYSKCSWYSACVPVPTSLRPTIWEYQKGGWKHDYIQCGVDKNTTLPCGLFLTTASCTGDETPPSSPSDYFPPTQ